MSEHSFIKKNEGEEGKMEVTGFIGIGDTMVTRQDSRKENCH